jgi:tRNA A-37 threonylcarbamoyl transferase component Bud32
VPSLAGTRIDKYEVLEEVGHGGMAVVYRGTDSVLEREVAVKVLHPHLADREESRERLRREALAVAKLRHENILEIFDYSGAEAQESYIVTEFIHGPTLREWIDETLDPRPAIAALIVHRLCLALSHAHKGGIVHRDIKPENVMIRSEDGCVKLMDFGIAQILDNQKLTLTGQLIGSPAYMAPELISGRPLDQRTDLFSVGILLYQLATGELPFAGRNPHEVLNRIADGDYPAPSTICPLVDRELESIMACALATNPDDRFQTVEAFGKALEAYLEEMGVQPAGVELAAYFRNPKSYVVELDERVSAALMKQADLAAKQGQSTRAIGLLGRVLELDAGHKEARALLDRLRRQERRMRQVLVGAGSLAAIGLVAAGVLLVPPDPPAEEYLESPLLAKAGPKTGGAVIPGSNDTPRANSAKDGASEDVPEEGEAGDGDDEAGVAPEEPPTKKKGNAPKRTTPPALAATGRTPCAVLVDGIPSGSRTNFRLEIQGTPYAIPQSGPVKFSLNGEAATATIVTNDLYKGSVRFGVEDCKNGDVLLDANLRPAKVTFKSLPPKTSVTCVKGCPKDYPSPQEPESMVPLPMRNLQVSVTFKYQADGFFEASKACLLTPGPNVCNVVLKPRPG